MHQRIRSQAGSVRIIRQQHVADTCRLVSCEKCLGRRNQRWLCNGETIPVPAREPGSDATRVPQTNLEAEGVSCRCSKTSASKTYNTQCAGEGVPEAGAQDERDLLALGIKGWGTGHAGRFHACHNCGLTIKCSVSIE